MFNFKPNSNNTKDESLKVLRFKMRQIRWTFYTSNLYHNVRKRFNITREHGTLLKIHNTYLHMYVWHFNWLDTFTLFCMWLYLHVLFYSGNYIEMNKHITSSILIAVSLLLCYTWTKNRNWDPLLDNRMWMNKTRYLGFIIAFFVLNSADILNKHLHNLVNELCRFQCTVNNNIRPT